MQNKRTFASRFFELFTLPASLRSNTQRRSASSMCAFKEERSVLISLTLMKGIAGYKTVPTIGIKFWLYVKGPAMWQRLVRKISFLNCLFVYFVFAIRISRFSILLFLLSAFFYPHFPIRIRHLQVSGLRFTDTPVCKLFWSRHAFSFRAESWKMFCFQRLSQYSNLYTFSGLKWNKLFLDFALLASRRLSLRQVSQPVSRELCYLAETISSFQGTFNALWRVN